MKPKDRGPSGILVMDKPEGPTSHDMVAVARRLLRTRQVGHTGTLDPMATGLLILCVGRATRLARFLTRRDKTYRGTLRLGFETDTQDRTGSPLGAMKPVTATAAEVESVMQTLTGSRMQLPPRFSAKKVNGVRAHRLARAGKEGQPEPVAITVDSFRLLEMVGLEATFEVRCSPGTYVRTLAVEIGRSLGCGAHLTALRRTESGEFDLSTALNPSEMAALARRHQLRDKLIPLGKLEMGLPSVTAREAALWRVVQGGPLTEQDLEAPIPATGPLYRVLTPSGELLAVGERTEAGASPWIQPRVVLLRPEELPIPVAGAEG